MKKENYHLLFIFQGSDLLSYSTVGKGFFLHIGLFIPWRSWLYNPVNTIGCLKLFVVRSRNVVEGLSSSQHCRVCIELFTDLLSQNDASKVVKSFPSPLQGFALFARLLEGITCSSLHGL